MNGTMLRLLEHRDEKLMVSADGMLVELPEEEAPRLQLAYACSIHKGQGIELPVAIVIAHPAAGPYFLRREMLYTAMTRAQVATLVDRQARRSSPARRPRRTRPDASHASGLGLRQRDGTCPPRRRARAPLGGAVSRPSRWRKAPPSAISSPGSPRTSRTSLPRCARCCRSWPGAHVTRDQVLADRQEVALLLPVSGG